MTRARFRATANLPSAVRRSLSLGAALWLASGCTTPRRGEQVGALGARNRGVPTSRPFGSEAAIGSGDWALGDPSTGDTAEFSVLISGRRAGRLRQWPDTSGTVTTTYRYDDRGRGPALSQTLRLDKAGLPVGLQLSGTGPLSLPVRETLDLTTGRLLTWRNRSEAGRAAVGAGFYLPMETIPTDLAALARALLNARTKSLSLLPDEGVATMTVGAPRTVTSGDREVQVTPYLIAGLGLTPQPIWLDRDQRLFASGGSRQMVIRRGFEGAVPALIAAQLETSRVRDSLRATRLARTPTAAVAIIHANLFDAAARKMLPGQTVIIRGDRIAAVGDDGAIPLPFDVEVIDAGNRALLPGLWDMHATVSDDDGLLHLAAGVTTVRDLTTDTDEGVARRARFDRGTLLGPRLLTTGFIDGPGSVGLSARQMVKAGVGELRDATVLFFGFLSDSAVDTRGLERFSAVARGAGSVSLMSDRTQRFIAQLRERDVVVNPTLNVFEQLFTARAGTLDPGSLPVATRLPPIARRSLLTGGLPAAPAQEPVFQASFIAIERLVKAMHDSGVRLVAGSDASAGFSLHRELELYAEAGLPNTDILYIATLGAARVTQRDTAWGSIEVGKFADLVLIDGDPTRRMRDLRRAELVMKGGVMYVPDSLYAAVGVKPAPRKGIVSTREVRVEDVSCRGPAAAVRRGSGTPVPLLCTVTDSTVGGARNRSKRARALRPVTKKKA